MEQIHKSLERVKEINYSFGRESDSAQEFYYPVNGVDEGY